MDWKAGLQKAVKEPLVHFLGAGLLLFLLMGGGLGDGTESRTINVSEEQVTGIVSAFAQSWQREPRPEEVDALIRDYVREEVYYREGKRLGLDEGDTIVRRRMRTKMEFMTASEAESMRPSDADLQKLLDTQPARYASEKRIGFDQVYLGQDGNGAAELAQLKAGASPDGMGQAISLPRSVPLSDGTEIDRQFGRGFAEQLTEQAKGQWGGPVTSGFGKHLVRVTALEPGALPKLEEVRQRLENDWRSSTRKAREEAAFKDMLARYTVRIEKPE